MTCERIYLKDHFPELGKDGCNAYMECYIPDPITELKGPAKTYPCMLICPGGAYYGVTRREGEVVGFQFLPEDYRFIVLKYSVRIHEFPQVLKEAAGAMELIYRNADAWGIDKDKIAVIGFSAGGHLAAQYANRYDCPEVREIFPESKPVAACILGYPVITADERYRNALTIRNFVGHGDPVGKDEQGCSCELLVSERTPPTFLWHTAEDKGVLVQNSLLYAMALSECGVPYEMHIYPYGPHGLSLANGIVHDEEPDYKSAHAQGWVRDVKAWLKVIGF